MGAKTKIQWTDATWNPVTGCTPVSPACDNCYARRIAKRFQGNFDVAEHRDRLGIPLRWRKLKRVFVCSMSDLFHEKVSHEFIEAVLHNASLTPHTFLFLTKRPERMKEEFSAYYDGLYASQLHKPVPRFWLGVTAENQEQADKRIPILLQIPAAVRFVSIEPMLSAVDLHLLRKKPCSHGGCFNHVSHPCERCGYQNGKLPLDWIIVGGETSPGARPIHPDWVRGVRDQCQAAGVPFFFKQWGEWVEKTWGIGMPEGQTKEESLLHAQVRTFSDGMQVARIGKNRAGSELDGKVWNEFPKGAQ